MSRTDDYDSIYTIGDYHDGPKDGVANYRNSPHYYSRLFDDNADEYSDYCLLVPIDKHALSLALEQWSLWLDWLREYEAGRNDIATHPLLDQENNSFKSLGLKFDETLKAHPSTIVIAKGNFKSEGPMNAQISHRITVRWYDEMYVSSYRR